MAASEDGTTALIGAPGDNEARGAAFVYAKSEGASTQRSAAGTAATNEDHEFFGYRQSIQRSRARVPTAGVGMRQSLDSRPPERRRS